MTQVPGPELIESIGLVGYLLVVLTVGGCGLVAWFLRRMAASMDRMAAAQEESPAALVEIRILFSERLDHIESNLAKIITLAEEHLQYARLWRSTEAPDRTVRKPPP